MIIVKERGFTLVEVIVVAAIVAILAGILVPLILKEIDEARISRASADIRSISTAMMVMKKDTGSWPITAACTPAITILQGNGTNPDWVAAGWGTNAVGSIDEYLSRDDNACWPGRWKGPYIALVNPDPWGRAYVINSADFLTNNPVWLLSAGPNNQIDTPLPGNNLGGDDIGIRLK